MIEKKIKAFTINVMDLTQSILHILVKKILKIEYFELIYDRTKVYNICTYLNSVVLPFKLNLRTNLNR